MSKGKFDGQGRNRKSDERIRPGWSPTMEQRADLEGRQVKCLIASAGHIWMEVYFDRLPKLVRQRLAESHFNICPACMDEEARAVASHPTIAVYFAVIESIERKLAQIS
jgi:hypothetical protein